MRLRPKRAEHRAADRDGILLFHTPHHHAKMTGFNDHTNAMRVQFGLEGLRDLHGEPFLHLEPARESIDDARNLAQSDDFLVRQIPHMHLAEERQHVVLAHAVEIDVFDDDHFIVLNREKCSVQELVDVAVIPLGHKREGLGHSLRRLEQSIAARVLPKRQQLLRDEGLQYAEICRPSSPTHIFYRLPPSARCSLRHSVSLGSRQNRGRSRIFKIVVSRLDDRDFLELPFRDLRDKQIPYQQHQVFTCRRSRSKLRVLIQILVIESTHNPLRDNSIKRVEIHSPLNLSGTGTPNCHEHDIIMAMPIGIIAFAEDHPVFFNR
ncbi:MAG: hypothetical protein LZF86_140027 [Nitrospira sp.]|nr:MAG: hypothetical protein LZF86_140027 [Nitrospira sp.]